MPASRAKRSDSGLVAGIALFDQSRLPKQRVVINDYFAVNRQQFARARDDQRINLGQFGVAFGIAQVEPAQNLAEGAPVRPRQAHSAGNEGHLVILQAGNGIDMLANDGLGTLSIQLLDIHAAFHRGHDQRFPGAAIVSDRQVDFLLDVRTGVDKDFFHAQSLDFHADDVIGVSARFIGIPGDFDAARLAAPTDVDLSLDDDNAAQVAGDGEGFVSAGGYLAERYGNAEITEKKLGLIFVQLQKPGPPKV